MLGHCFLAQTKILGWNETGGYQSEFFRYNVDYCCYLYSDKQSEYINNNLFLSTSEKSIVPKVFLFRYQFKKRMFKYIRVLN